MSLDSRRHVRNVSNDEPVSPLELPDGSSTQSQNVVVSRDYDGLHRSLSIDSLMTFEHSDNTSQGDAEPGSPARYLPNYHYTSSSHPLSSNLRTPSPSVLRNSGHLYPTSECSKPIRPKAAQNTVSSPTSHRSLSSSWWWWWEILAMILSLASMSLLAFLLSKINGIPLASWDLPIVPQSLIAILTTVGKTSLLVPVASCIGQLKWHHFAEKPRKLINFQLFDDASRGPWGSVLLVWHLAFRAQVLVALGFALITVLALGIDPSAQQIIKLPVKESPLKNVSVLLGAADFYYSKGLLENTDASEGTWQANSDLLSLQSSIINGVTGSVFQPSFDCPGPAARCTWDTFTTFGVYGEFKDVSKDAVAHCSGDDSSALNCTYTVPGIDNLPVDNQGDMMIMQWNTESTGGAGPSTMLFQSLFHLDNSENPGYSHIGSFLAVKAIGDGYPLYRHNATGATVLSPPPTEVYYATFEWCAKTYHNVSASQKNLNKGPVTSQELTFADRVEFGDVGNLIGATYLTYTSNATGATFNLTNMAHDVLPSYLGSLLTTTVYHNIYRPDIGPDTDLVAIGFALMNSNLSHVVPDIADTLTNQIRSNNPGDNYNATNITGQAYFDEPYIEVRWVYLTLPFSVTLLSAILLAITIIITDKQPLLKHSSMAFLVNRLEGWDDEELNVDGPQTQEKLERLAETMVARLEEDQNGRRRLVRKI
ncbi:hypothetical protein F5Y10DRAFT_233625 [Nemania abortiva]|nr:hypothetical protein F5Y10DRAFT_233625 [Nemania abortiva]